MLPPKGNGTRYTSPNSRAQRRKNSNGSRRISGTLPTTGCPTGPGGVSAGLPTPLTMLEANGIPARVSHHGSLREYSNL
ncbi:Uncharacterised protein [Mycobacteroides abscessus subsp. abscessus]|nr:Uncharacterised protein [Mycobacteroides abscessus subsp. abscessus]